MENYRTVNLISKKHMKLNSLLFLLMIDFAAFGQSNQNVSSKITDVTVFLNRAQVTREAKVQLTSGKTNLVVSGLTSLLDPNSIQVSGKGNFIILGTSYQQNYLSEMNLRVVWALTKDRSRLAGRL